MFKLQCWCDLRASAIVCKLLFGDLLSEQIAPNEMKKRDCKMICCVGCMVSLARICHLLFVLFCVFVQQYLHDFALGPVISGPTVISMLGKHR